MAELESSIEARLIEQLTKGASQWSYRDDLRTEDELWDNLKQILENNNRDKLKGTPLSHQEFQQVKNQLSFASPYEAAKWIVGENGKASVHVQRGSETLHLFALSRADVAGGRSVYEVIHQCQTFKDDEHKENSRARRFDVTLLINGIPLIHLELKNKEHPYMDGFRQIVKYMKEDQFTGIFSAIQMFVVSNGVDTKYIAAARWDELNAQFLSGWVDAKNEGVHDLFAFAEAVLKIPDAHELITHYAVLDTEKKRILLLRPYQIHAIKALRAASKRRQSGYIWHTTGSGKTLTSYKAARNLLLDIPAIDKTIFLVDRRDLDQQTSEAFTSYAENDLIDVDETEHVGMLRDKLLSNDRQMIVTTRQKLQILKKRLDANPDSKVYKKLSKLNVAFVVDECHRAVSPMTKRDIESFFPQSLWYGFTGTPRFSENAYAERGDLPRTTEALYGPCLHMYTVKEAIHDGAVLGFQVEHLGPKGLEGDGEEDLAVYEDEAHMLQVLDYIVNQSAEKLALHHGAGKTYEAILTTSSIAMAQKYYKLLKRVKAGETTLKIREEIKQKVPDFPKFAITYSVGENGEGDLVNQTEMAASMADYNAMFGTHFGLDQIQAYNADLNQRLSRKGQRFLSRANQLDLVIVVDRLLTGFDAPCLSTLFIDRQPMRLHDLLQAFSRTNRIFDRDKTYGQILTFQSPRAFKDNVDDALRLFSHGGESAVLAPDWEKAEAEFIDALAALRQFVPDPRKAPDLSRKGKKKFLVLFQHFDRAFQQVRAFIRFQEKNLERDYGLSMKEYENYRGAYVNIWDELVNKPDPDPNKPEPDGKGGDDGTEEPDLEYELTRYGRETVDYEYIVALMQSFVDDDRLMRDQEEQAQYDRQKADITKYLDKLVEENPKFGMLLKHLWEEALARPDVYRGKSLMAVFEEKRKETIQRLIEEFSKEWKVDEKLLGYAASQYHSGEKVLGMEEIKKKADYDLYAAERGRNLKKFQYRSALEKATVDFLQEDILPLQEGKSYVAPRKSGGTSLIAAEEEVPYGKG